MSILAARSQPLVRTTRRAVRVSVGGMLLVALVAATPSSPFPPVLPRGMEPTGPFRWLADLVGLSSLGPTALMFVGLMATTTAAIGFILVLREAWNGRISMRTVLILSVLYVVAVLTLPLLFSRDVYSYGYYGRMVSTYHVNPYIETPRDFDLNSLYRLTYPGWRSTPSVYGPLFTWLSAGLTWTTKSIEGLITGFQLIAAAAFVGTIAIIARVVTRVRPERAVFAVAVVGLNPIVIFHVVGGGHNDMLLALFVSAAVALLFAKRELLAAVALALGMSVKASAVVPLILLIVAVVAAAEPERRRAVALRFAAVSGGLWLALAFPFLQLQNPTLGLLEASGHDSGKAPGQLVVRGLSAFGSLLLGDTGGDVGATVGRLLLLAMSAIGVFMIARRIWRDPATREPTSLVAAWAWALLVVVLLSPVLGAWYLVWILPLAWVLPRVGRRVLVLLSASFIVTELVTESSRIPLVFQSVKLPFGHPLAILLAIWVIREVLRHLRGRLPFDVDDGRPEFGDRFESGPRVEIPDVEPMPVPADPREPRIQIGLVRQPSLMRRRR
ncbi:MAG TPA: glycosyltransferase 87 family protein [Actinomycetota bacterium]|jgi:alpha-1,6-mannosyltransferase